MDGEVTSEHVIEEQVAWTKASLDLYWISIEKWDALLGYYMEKKVIQSHEAVNIWFLQCNAFKRMEKNLIERQDLLQENTDSHATRNFLGQG